VFKVKRNTDRSVERYKARVVAQGFAQYPGFDYTETFTPTLKWPALCTILALAVLEDLHLESVDISSAFLNGELKEEVYLCQLEGFVEKGNNWVWHLLKSIYGLKDDIGIRSLMRCLRRLDSGESLVRTLHSPSYP